MKLDEEKFSYVILLADDNMFNLLILEKLLINSLYPFQILKAYDGK